jgi:hypothetical protein
MRRPPNRDATAARARRTHLHRLAEEIVVPARSPEPRFASTAARVSRSPRPQPRFPRPHCHQFSHERARKANCPNQCHSEGWRLVAFGDIGVVERAFFEDSPRSIHRAGALSSGHHDAAVASLSRWRSQPWQLCSGYLPCGKEDPAARSGLVGLARRRFPDHSAIGELGVAPGPKRF